MKKLPKSGVAAPWRSGVAWAALDVGQSVWKHRDKLVDETTRGEAYEEVAWDAGEAAVRGVAGAGTGAVVTASLTVAQGATFAGATLLSASAVTVGAPLVVGGAAGWAGARGVRALRRRRVDQRKGQ